MSLIAALLAALIFIPQIPAADHFLSPKGNDTGPGSRLRPWRTLEKVNASAFKPGDRILLEGGATFSGTLRLGAKHSGSTAAKVTLASYGTGRATIDGAKSEALILDGASHVIVRELNFTGAGRKAGSVTSGVVLRASRDLTLDRIEVRGFRSSGIEIGGVENARITRVWAHLNGFAGISSRGARSRNLYIAYCLAENNPGDPAVRKNHSGNGIVIGEAQDVLIEYCEARYNGWDMPWTGNGPVGIWAYRSDKVVIRFCVAHHNRSTAADGGGFDFDGGMTNSVLEYNYSHSNFGTGYLICQYKDAGLFENNVVRYNISQDDGLFDHNSGVYVWVGGGLMKSTLVHNNTIFNSKGSAVVIAAAKEYLGQMPRLTFHNNIFVTQGPQLKGAQHGRFIGNLYWSVGERGFRADEYKSFDEWVAATGQEKFNNRVVGVYADPLLRKDDNGLLTEPKLLPRLLEYQLLPGSPAIDSGLDLRTLFQIDPGKRDFYGTLIPVNGKHDMGAHEFSSVR